MSSQSNTRIVLTSLTSLACEEAWSGEFFAKFSSNCALTGMRIFAGDKVRMVKFVGMEKAVCVTSKALAGLGYRTLPDSSTCLTTFKPGLPSSDLPDGTEYVEYLDGNGILKRTKTHQVSAKQLASRCKTAVAWRAVDKNLRVLS